MKRTLPTDETFASKTISEALNALGCHIDNMPPGPQHPHLSFVYTILQSSVAEILKKSDALQLQVAQLQSKNDRLENDLAEAEDDHTAVVQENERLTEIVTQLQQNQQELIEEMEKVEEVEEDKYSLKLQNKQLIKDNQALIEENQELADDLEELEEEISVLRHSREPLLSNDNNLQPRSKTPANSAPTPTTPHVSQPSEESSYTPSGHSSSSLSSPQPTPAANPNPVPTPQQPLYAQLNDVLPISFAPTPPNPNIPYEPNLSMGHDPLYPPHSPVCSTILHTPRYDLLYPVVEYTADVAALPSVYFTPSTPTSSYFAPGNIGRSPDRQ